MANNIKEYGTLIQENLDKKMVQESVTGWMENNIGEVIYNGGRKVKIPKIEMDGLGNYIKDKGFTGGSVTFEYEEREMKYDRGRSFSVDSMDVDETGFVLVAGRTMDEFQRTHVVPEVDTVRLSTLATLAINNNNAAYGYTPDKKTALDTLKDAISTMRDKGFSGRLMVHCTYEFKTALEKGLTGQLSPATLTLGGITTEVPSVDGCPLIATESSKMVSAIDLLDGTTSGQEAGGFKKSANALGVNFILVAEEAPIAISKTDKLRIFDPEINQDADAWKADYRKYHDIWVLDNKINGVYVNIKDAKPAGATTSASK